MDDARTSNAKQDADNDATHLEPLVLLRDPADTVISI